jgi:hypothetical protein
VIFGAKGIQADDMKLEGNNRRGQAWHEMREPDVIIRIEVEIAPRRSFLRVLLRMVCCYIGGLVAGVAVLVAVFVLVCALAK